jgi:DNA adenine methylase
VTSIRTVVNVASVPKRSPFRYPGGKTWLVPTARLWLRSLERLPARLIEPFAGGGIIGLTAAFEGLAAHVVLVEKDPDVAAVWQAVISRSDGEWLATKIAQFDFTPKNVVKALETRSPSTRVRAFQTILRNRVQRGGIMAPGAGLMKNGENGKGISSRWYPQTLSRRIREIAAIRERLTFHHGDGLAFLESEGTRLDTAFFIDPPYTVAGARLYRYSEIDHESLLHLVARLEGEFLVTYDDSPDVRGLAEHSGLEFKTIPMKNTHHEVQQELIISRRFSWLHAAPSRVCEQYSLQSVPC